MSHASLASRYRPQTFAEVSGQTMIKTILSRAAAQDKVAPAYLFSGTRGVGKTTIARIFAKALNCEHAPVAEPCNACSRCRQITQGNYVDVVEIDGASNTGVEDARHLKEVVGYAPMDGRYKVFIIDEAHMLSNNAFNALLKTIEEPPPHVVFIMATTEPRKFPATILSRCQHFVFHPLSEHELEQHLREVLGKENLSSDDASLRLIARRGAGSVRDSMSLLDQTLALSEGHLDENTTRQVLGMVRQEAYQNLLTAIATGDCLHVVDLTRELLENGADIGFFLRELSELWRNLFLVRAAGSKANPADLARTLDIPPDELPRQTELAAKFSETFIHAAWQMVLGSQRQILTSLEPATSLELLLLNLTVLPRLVPLASLPADAACMKPGTGHASPDGSGKSGEAATQACRIIRSAAAASPDRAPAENPRPDTAARARKRTSDKQEAASGTTKPAGENTEQQPGKANWTEFVAFCKKRHCSQMLAIALGLATGSFAGNVLQLCPFSDTQQTQLADPARKLELESLATEYLGVPATLVLLSPRAPVLTEAELRQRVADAPEVQALRLAFDAQIAQCTQNR